MKTGDRRSPVLVLGGTAEARELASALHESGAAVVTALAGRTRTPRLPAGQVRSGGFNGPDGLSAWLVDNDVSAVVDATHPFAVKISASARAASARANVPLLRLERPCWRERPGDRWHLVNDLQQAADLVAHVGQRAWLTIGRQGVRAFAAVDSCWFLVRCVEPPAPPLPRHHEVILDRGPYALPGEVGLLDRHRIDVLVTRESGGAATEAKLEAARLRQLPVILIRRPRSADVLTVSTVAEAIRWTLSVLGDGVLTTAEPRGR